MLREIIPKLLDEAPADAGIYTFLNPYSYLIIRRIKKGTLEDFDGIYIDGIALVTLLRLLKIKLERKSFDMTTLGREILSNIANTGKTVYFIGAKDGVVERAIQEFKKIYPDLNVVGFRHGYFDSAKDITREITKILIANPDYLIVGMGTPFQENFLAKVKKAGWKGIAFTCGGFLHQTAKKGTIYYPKLINTLNLRWFYRIIDEPKLLKRYAIEYPVFLVYFLIDVLKTKR